VVETCQDRLHCGGLLSDGKRVAGAPPSITMKNNAPPSISLYAWSFGFVLLIRVGVSV